MFRYMMFGILPVTFTPDGVWQVDTGTRSVDVVAGVVARGVLKAIDAVERVFGVVIPVHLTPTEQATA